MKSKTFFSDARGWFHPTLYCKNLTRFWPLWTLASLGGSLFPLAGISYWMRNPSLFTPAECDLLYYNVTAYAVPCVFLCYCVLCAMCVWGYLDNPRAVGLMHTLPIRREGLFLTNFLSGLTMTAIPCAVTGVFAVILSLLGQGFHLKVLLVTILAVAGEGFFYFSTATAAAFITGNIFAFPVLYGIFHFLASGLDFMISSFAANTIFGLRGRYYTGVVDFLSPTVYLIKHVRPNAVYEKTERFRANGSSYWVSQKLVSATLENAWVIGLYVLAGIVLTGIAWAFYRRRRSECAGDVIAVGWGKPVFQAGVTLCCGMGGGQLLYLLFDNDFNGDAPYRLLPLVVCMILTALIGYYASAMLLEKSLRVFQGSLPGVCVTALCCVLAACVVHFDVLNVAGRIPADSALAYVHVYVAGNNYDLVPGKDDELIAQVKELHRAIVPDADYIRNSLRYPPQSDGGDPWGTEYLRLNYVMKNGLTVDRSYTLFLRKSRMEQPGTFDYLLDRLVNGEGMKNERLHAGDPDYVPVDGSIYFYRSDRVVSLSTREVNQLLEAFRKDTAAGAWNYDWFQNDDANRYAVTINLSFSQVAENGQEYNDWLEVILRPGMEASLQALRDLGYLEEDDPDLITWEEYYKLTGETDEDYASMVPETVERAVGVTAAADPNGLEIADTEEPAGTEPEESAATEESAESGTGNDAESSPEAVPSSGAEQSAETGAEPSDDTGANPSADSGAEAVTENG